MKSNFSFITVLLLISIASLQCLSCSVTSGAKQTTMRFAESKTYDTPINTSQHSKLLPQNIVDGVNTLTQTMLNEPNTTCIIKYDYVLGEIITIPSDCELYFLDGSIKGKRIVFDNTRITGKYNISCGLSGTIANKQIEYKGFEGCDLIELCAAIRNCSLNLIGYTFNLTKDLIINGGTTIVGGTITTEGRIKNEGGYYNNAFGASRKDLKRDLLKEATKGTRSLTLLSVEGLSEGDYIKIGNGYQSLWTVLEKPLAREKWVLGEKTGWDYQIAKIKRIKGNTITIDKPLEHNFPVKAIATGLINNEDLGNAFVCEIGQVKNVVLDGCVIKGDVAFVNCDSLTIKNCTISSLSGKTLMLGTCINSKVINNHIYSEGYAISLESQTYNTIVEGNHCVSNGSQDACVLTMLGVSKCRISNNTVIQNNKWKIGIYLNTSKDNAVIDNMVYDAYEAVRSGYSFGGAYINGNTGNNCSVFWFNHARNDTAVDNRLINHRLSPDVANGLQMSYSKNIVIDSLTVETDREQSRIQGVVDCVIRNSKLNTLYVLKPEDAIVFTFERTKGFEVNSSSLRGLLVSDGGNGDNGGNQEKVFRDCSFTSKCIIGYNATTQQNRFYNCTFTNASGIAVEVTTTNNTFHDCLFDGSTGDVVQKGKAVTSRSKVSGGLNDFKGSTFVHEGKSK